MVDAKLAKLAVDHRLQSAAAIGHVFKLDPVAVLEETDPLKVLLRIAAVNFIQNERDKSGQGGKGRKK